MVGVSYISAHQAKSTGKITTQGVTTSIHAAMLSMKAPWMVAPYRTDVLISVQRAMAAGQENQHLFPQALHLKLAGTEEDRKFVPAKAYVNSVMAASVGIIGIAVATFDESKRIPEVVVKSLASLSGTLYRAGNASDEAADTLSETVLNNKVNREADPIMIAEIIASATGKGSVQDSAKKIIDLHNRTVTSGIRRTPMESGGRPGGRLRGSSPQYV